MAAVQRAQNEGTCKATGFDPWWAGSYDLTVECEGEGLSTPLDICIIPVKEDYEEGIRMAASILNGQVVAVTGTILATGQSFLPAVSIQKTVEGLEITIST